MKKLLCILLSTILVATLLAGCNSGSANDNQSGGTTAAETNTTTTTESATETTTDTTGDTGGELNELNIAIFEGGFGPDFWNQIAELFEADNPGTKVNVQISPNIAEVVRPQIVAGNSPDFVNFSAGAVDGLMATMIKDNALLDLTDVVNGPQWDSDTPLKDKIIPGFLESNECAPYGNGKVYLVPGAYGPMGPIYDRNLFQEMGWSVPVTWDEYFELGDKAKAEGIALQAIQSNALGYWESVLLPALASALGSDFDKVLNFTPGIWSDPRAIAVLEQFEKMYTGDYLLAGTMGLNHTQSQTYQMLGEALFIPCGTWMEGEMADSPRRDGYQFGITPTPVLSAGDTRYVAAYTETFSIPAGAANPELAKVFLRYMYTDKIIELYAQLNGGAVIATTNGQDLAKPYLTEDTYGMYTVFSQPGSAALFIAFEAIPEGSIYNTGDMIFGPTADVLTGRMTALEWAAQMDADYLAIADGN